MLNSRMLALIGQLGDASRRITTARELASELGVEEVIIFTPDPEIGVLLPAPGFPQTLVPGRRWRRFLDICALHGQHSSMLMLDGRELQAYGYAALDGSTLVLLGGQPWQTLVDDMMLVLPLLSSAFARDQAGITAAGHAAAARQVAERSEQLATALDDVRRDLQEALGRAQQAIRERDVFVSVAAHELNTPIATLKAMAQLQRRRINRMGTVDPIVVSDALHQIDEQASKVAQLVSQLLDISRLESGHLPLAPAETDIVSLVRDITEASQAQTHKHTLRLEAPTVLVAQFDALRMEQVLNNVIDNAMKYSRAGGLIQIYVRLNGDTFSIVIEDQGPGIPAAQHEQIFERFHRADATDYNSGLGIGLFVSRQIVDLHGGQIHAENRDDREGARFVITLPVKIRGRATQRTPG